MVVFNKEKRVVSNEVRRTKHRKVFVFAKR
jgi:hypothetical protein